MRSTHVLPGLLASAAAHYIHDPRVLSKRAEPGQCGPEYDGQVCADGQCCSQYGWCGTTAEFCAAPGCQADYSGKACDAETMPPGESTVNVPRPQLGNIPYGVNIEHCVKPGQIALTFDDGPYIYTTDLLDKLAAAGVKATFFMNGNNGAKGPIYEEASGYPALVRRMFNDGHQIASHSWSHADHDAISAEEREMEIIKNEMTFVSILGLIPTYYRPPYVICGDGCHADLLRFGYHISLYDIDTRDWEVGGEAASQIFDSYVLGSDPSTTSWLVLAHDIHEGTVEILADRMIWGAKSAGYELVTMGECLGDDKANWYRDPKTGGAWSGNVPDPVTTSAPSSTSESTTSTAESTTNASESTTNTSESTTSTAESTTNTSESTTSTAESTTSTAESTTSTAESTTSTSESTTGKPTGTETEPTKTGDGSGTSKPTGTGIEPTKTGDEPTITDKPTADPTITDSPKPTEDSDDEDDEEEDDGDVPDYTPPPSVETTVCSNKYTTVTLTWTSTYCPRPTAPPGAGDFGAGDSEGIYTPGWKSPNSTTTYLGGPYPTGSHGCKDGKCGGGYGSGGNNGNGGNSGCSSAGCGGSAAIPSPTRSGSGSGSGSESTFVSVSGASAVKVAGTLFIGLIGAALVL